VTGRSRSGILLAGLFAASALGGCAVHTVNTAPEVRLAGGVPGRFAEVGDTAGAGWRADWWRAFGSPEVDATVARVLAGGLDVRRAHARVRQAEALGKAAGATQWPTLNATGQAAYARNVFNLGALGVRSIEAANYQFGLAAQYEVDLWGRLASGNAAAAEDLAAAREDRDALAVALSARAVEAALGLAGERELLGLLNGQVASAERLVALVEARFGQGLATALEVYQQRQQLAALSAQLPLSEARIAVLGHQLAALSGEAPSAAPQLALSALPELPSLPDVGVPSALLARRPDVRAAMRRVVAADHRVAAAVAAQYPALNLSAGTGFQGPDLFEILKRWVWNIGAGLVGPLIDGGRRQAEVARTKAAVEEALEVYAQAALVAIVEVEDALVQGLRQAEHVAAVREQLRVARLAQAESEARYLNGLASYLEVLTTQRSLQQAEVALLAARRQAASMRVQLHRALGGGWEAIAAAQATQPDTRSAQEPRDASTDATSKNAADIGEGRGEQ
jgi:NodT family efflux transporter outer membrane factor (OMF) lipoprotein